MPNLFTEDDIERTLLERLHELYGYEVLNCMTAQPGEVQDGSGRHDKREVILGDRLQAAARRLNPHIPEAARELALAQFAERRQAMTLVAANRELDALLRDGIAVRYQQNDQWQQEQLRLIDFAEASNNDFLAVTQLWIKGINDKYLRPDVLLYVNGIPLVFIELKNSNIPVRNAYDDNLVRYRQTIPQLFLTNAFCVLSNALETRVGSLTAEWEHFFSWLRVDDEKEKLDRAQIKEQGTSIERVISGLLAPELLLDYVENYVLFHKQTQKIIAQNHQFIGVNRAFARFQQRKVLRGKLGVFWHTQGSGKSFSMIFYARKILRKLPGHFTFLVVTDRDDLDGQIFRNFLNTGTVQHHEAARPKNSEELRAFLGQSKRLVFTLIQKFRYDKGKTYPLLSPRDDIVVIVDEAHRTQYKSLAENMRAGLPQANFVAFTGTPLLGRERKTNQWFGDYVSEYNFQQSMDDGATVPLFYQKRVPEVLIQNDDLSEEFYQILEEENLDEAQQEKLERQFSQEIQVIKRDDRMETIARDIVYHFPRRGYLGKGIVIAVDKFTAVKLYDKVQRLWKEELKALRKRIKETPNEVEKARLKKIVAYMHGVQMAVVISEEAGEEEKFKQQGLEALRHRQRINALDEHGHDIEHNFKDPEHPLQLVFVCAMWLTGFDAPTVSTLYLDKPMKGHTLMQTIARANRVTSHQINGIPKSNGEIVDYYNVFRNMKQALKDYAQGEEGTDKPPVQDKSVLRGLLEDAIAEGLDYCRERAINLEEVLGRKEIFKNLGRFNEFADILLGNEEWRKTFNVYQNTILALYEACKPEILGNQLVRVVAAFDYLRGVIDSLVEQVDINRVTRRIDELLDESVVVDNAEAFHQQEPQGAYQIVRKGRTWDLSKIDFDKLREEFKQTVYKNIEIADLRGFLEQKIAQMMAVNKTRSDFAQRLQEIIDRYNAGGSATEDYHEELLRYLEALSAEDDRHIREGLSEDELELFDLLKKDSMTQDETQKVKLAAKSLLQRLLDGQPKVLVQDWFKDGQTQRIVRTVVEQVLDNNLPDSYNRAIFKEKCNNVFELILDYASHGRKWAA
ncbi:type I restriction endonuclease subunit R [Pseudomonas rhizosphaerae]|uniref:type I restriction endonuclease subunit R n=1 Tax=Pseudomonas rhizosphaerae TaxID=216142 RepID=UPI002B49A64F|nr:type I restriction endonuclease subunit R [Pseudomonas rhizosphaerae]MEB2872948.1 type I restriction endonuclease subunit R [Pseudomonas rhizosphaerae]